ncbi:adenosylcobinamide-GDP ribazoletransferase [Rhodococcus sp. NPDC058505]|uniref:adenosylcobinamide-GDP ribazoletransferase n=1 Tax=unclassified Rhodococcus (in: high G+C Gram-positive bacteria) TaxID=192944 RepID=UPI0036626746
MGGLRLALSWLTVLPLPHRDGGPPIDRAAGRRAIAAAPVVGVLLGLLAAAVTAGLLAASLGAALAGLAAVAVLALATRGMHVDGLADTVDGLGCYGPPERALEVMRSGGVGPFGAAALVIVLGGQALAFGSLAASGQWAAVLLAVAAGRVAAVLTCRPTLPAATATGFGALVAGTQPAWVRVAWTALIIGASTLAVPDRWWQGPLVAAVVLAAVIALTGHCARRFGGITGDVLGAAIEVTVAATAAGFLLGG